ncbi:MAG: ATP-binding protein [Bacteroidales bacterium]|nr:ATP-binding protein [Bacteroidales bacterium]
MEKVRINRGSRFAILVAIFGIVLTIAQFIFWNIILKQVAYRNVQRQALSLAGDISSRVSLFFRDAYVITQTYALNFLEFKQMKVPRFQAYHFLKSSLPNHPNFLALWTQWEPNAYDGKDALFANDGFHDSRGHFSASYFLCDKGICTELNDTSFYSADFYLIPRKLRKPVLLDPYHYQYLGNSKIYYETSLVYPIIENETFLGVMAVDIDLFAFPTIFKDFEIFHGNMAIISNNGTIVYHSDTAYFNDNIYEYCKGMSISLKDSFSLEKPFHFNGSLTDDKQEYFFYFFPINEKFMAAPWYVMVQFSKKEILAEFRKLILIALIFTTASVFLIVYLIYNIIDRRRNEKALIEAFEEVSRSRNQLQKIHYELERNHQLLTSMFNQTFTYVCLLTPEGVMLKANQTILDFLGVAEHELAGKFFHSLPCWQHSIEMRDKVKDALRKSAKGENVVSEVTLLGKEGKYFHLILSVRPIYDKSKEKVIYLMPEGIDITSIKEAEAQLLMYQNHLEELVNKRTQEVLQLNDELVATNEELKATNENLNEKNRELEDALAKLHQAQERLIVNEKMASLGIFTAGIAHEINNPLNYISASIPQLFECFEQVKDKMVEQTPEICASYQKYEKLKSNIELGLARITDIIASLRNYSYSPNENFVEYNILQCIYDAKTLLFNKHKNRITFVENFESIPEIKCIPGKINQMFVNLFSNAIDAIDGDGTITVNIHNINNKKIEIEVKDTGCGIKDKDLPKVFDPFFTTKTVGVGVGLGLYIVYSIVEQHHGKISIHSIEGKGTTVKIILPIR